MIEVLVADGFARRAASAFVQRVSRSPEGRAARARGRAGVFLAGFLTGLAALGVVGATCSRFWLGWA